MSITLGPVIGTTTQNSTRILVEFDSQSTQEIKLKGQDYDQGVKKDVQQNMPQIYSFDGLKASQKYTIFHNEQEIGSFITVKEDEKADLNIAFISCNDIRIGQELSKQKQLWRDMAERIKNQEIDQLIHIGDQVYIDHDYWHGDKENAYYKIEQKVKDLNSSEFDSQLEWARDLVRQEYRNTWNFEPTKYCLSHAASRMILDDHEVVDDIGFSEVKQGSWQEWYNNKVARYVYYQYERQLDVDVDFENLDSVDHEYREFIINQSGFFMMDVRAHFVWHGDKYGKEYSYMGESQKAALRNDLSENGKFKDVKSLFFVNTIPTILLSQRMLAISAKGSNDMTNHWIYQHEQELIEVLNMLREWQNGKEGRIVTLIGGDSHIGGFHDIYYDSKPVFKQMVTSPIAQKHIPKYAEIMFEVSSEISEILEGNYGFEKHDFIYTQNYGLVKISNDSKGQLVEMGLVSNKGSKMRLEKTWNNRVYCTPSKRTSACCEIF